MLTNKTQTLDHCSTGWWVNPDHCGVQWHPTVIPWNIIGHSGTVCIWKREWSTVCGNTTLVTEMLVLPKKFQQDVFHQLHRLPSTGHFGVTTTLSHAREHFYWAQCHQSVHDWSQSCDSCASRRDLPRDKSSHVSVQCWSTHWIDCISCFWTTPAFRRREQILTH